MMKTAEGARVPTRRTVKLSMGGLLFSSCLLAAACGDPGSSSPPPTASASSTAASPSATASSLSAAATTDPTASPSATSSTAALDPTASAAPVLSGAAVVKSAAPDPGTSAAPTASPSASVAVSATASAAPDAPLTVQSDKVQGDNFGVWMQTAKSYKVGQTGSVEVVVVPKGEFHCNEAYPYKVKLGAAPAGVTYPQDVVRGASISAARASIRVPFVASAAGSARISGKFYFSVCKADQCVIDSREVAATVKVE